MVNVRAGSGKHLSSSTTPFQAKNRRHQGFCKTNETFDSVEKMKQTQQSLVVLDLTVVVQKKENVPSKINVKSALQCVHASKRQFIVCLL